MAKSLRASGKKANRQALRAKVFAPKEQERLERLAAQQKAISDAPKPARPEMDIDNATNKNEEAAQGKEDTAMDIDGETTKSTTSPATRKSSRIEKRVRPIKRQKPRNAIVFPKFDKRKGKMVNRNKKSS